MPRKYHKVEDLAEIVLQRKATGETNREIAASYGLTKEQIKNLVHRQNRKKQLIAHGYVPRKKGRPRKDTVSEDGKKDHQIAYLQMQVEVLQNFLLEVGRRCV